MVAGWLAGVIILAVRRAGGFVVLWRLRRRGVSAPTDDVLVLFKQACGKIGIDPRLVCLKISDLVQVPMTMGWVRPIVLFPAALLTGLSTGEIELLLAHELAHIRRYDYLVNLLQAVVETLFFYHPAVWWISRRMRQERENACDDMVAAGSTEALAYAKVLLRLETLRPPGGLLAPAATGGSLLQRVQRLAGDSSPAPVMGLPGLITVTGILLLIAVLPLLKAQTNSAPMSLAEAQGKGIAALVNGKPILWADITRFDRSPQTAASWWGRRELFIENELIVQKFEASGEQLSPDYLNEADNKLADALKGFDGDRNAFFQNLQKNGISLEQWNESNRRAAIVGYMEKANIYDPAEVHILGRVRRQLNTQPPPLTKDEGKRLGDEYEKVRKDWLDSLRTKAVIQKFDEPDQDSSTSGSIIPTSFNPDAATAPMTEAEAKQKGIVALVNNEPVLMSEVIARAKSGGTPNPSAANLHDELNYFIDRKLVLQSFVASGKTISESQIDNEMKRFEKKFDQIYHGDHAAYARDRQKWGLNEAYDRRQIRENDMMSSMEGSEIIPKYLEYFQQHQDLFPQDEQVNVTLIMIDCGDGTTTDEPAATASAQAAQQAANEVKKWS